MTSVLAAVGLFGVVAAGIVISSAPQPAVAATGINHAINFQGKVVNSDGTNVANGTYSFTFKLYSVASGGSAIWTETKSLAVSDGIFQTNLGDVTSLPGSVDFNTDGIFLGINFNSDGEMTPRIQFTAAAYAFNSEKLGGLTAAQFAQLSPASAQSGYLNVSGNVTSGATVAAATSLQAPLVDTASAVALNIGTGTASSVTVGRATSSNTVTIQGSNASTWVVTGASGTTTLAFAAPTSTNTITFANAGGTVCTTVATTCSATYQAASATGYLLKNAADTSSASTLGSLLGLTNTNTGAAGVLSLTNSGTNAALVVSQSGNPTSGQALVVVNNTNGTPSGNLIDLQAGGVSKLAIDTAGNVTQAGGTSTTDTINGQRISAAANFTGTVNAAVSLLTPLLDTPSGTTTLAIGTTNATAGINLNQSTTVAAGKSLTVDTSTLVVSGSTHRVGIGVATPKTTLDVAGSISTLANNVRTYENVYSSGGTANQTGDFELVLPSNAGTSILSLTLSGYDYSSTSGGWEATIAATSITTNWFNASAQVSGKAPFSSLRLGYDTGLGRPVILLGSTSTAWNFPQISLTEVVAGYGNQDNWGSGYSSAYITSEATLTGLVTPTLQQTATTDQTFIQGGNSFGTAASLGTNDANSLQLRTGGTTRLTLDTSGNATLTGNLTVQGVGSSSIAGTLAVTGAVTGGTYNSQTISSTASFTGTVQAATSFIAPLVQTVDTGAGNSGALVIRSGNASGGNSNSGSITIDSGTHAGTGSSGNILIGQTNAGATLIGRAASQLTLQGVYSTSSIIASNGANSTTISFAQPTATNAITVPNAGGNLCTSVSSTCSTTYQIAGSYQAAGNYLLQNPGSAVTSTSSFTGYQYSFIQNSATAAGALSLQSAGTNAAFSVSQSGNPTSGQAVILANNTNASPSGNLLDLQTNATSKFSVAATGAVTNAGTINGQTISSSANFTGTVIAANQLTVSSGGVSVTGNSTIAGTLGGITGLTVVSGGASIGGNSSITGTLAVTSSVSAPVFQSVDTSTSSTNSSALALRSGNATGTSSNSGAVSLDSGTATAATGAVSVGTANASAVNVGRTGAALALQGSNSSTLVIGNGTNTTTMAFANPSANVTYTLGTAAAGSYNLCTSVVASCSGAYQVAGSYLIKNAIESSSATLSTGQTLLSLANNGSGTSGVLSVSNGAATGDALYVTAASNPTAGNALIVANNTTGAAGGNLLDLQVGGTSKYSVNYQGNTTGGTYNGQTISSTASFTGTVTSASTITASAGGINVTGASTFNNGVTITGALTANGGANVTGGLTVTTSGLAFSGAGSGGVTGLTSLQFSSTGSIDTNSAVALNIGTGNTSALTVGRAGATLALQGNAGSTFAATNAGNTTTVGFVAPTANIIYQFANASTGTYQLCSTYASTCGTTYAAYYAGGYVQLAPSTVQTDASLNPSLSINKTGTGALVNLQSGGNSVFAVQSNGTFNETATAYLGGTSSNALVTVDTSNFRVKIGTGTPTQSGGSTNADAALYVSGTAEAAGLVLIGNSTDNATFNGTSHELTLNGTARHARTVHLTAEYAGAVIDAGSGGANTGTMTAGFDNTNRIGFYKWTTSQSTAQTYDVVVNLPIPDDWAAWNGNPTFRLLTSSTGSTNQSVKAKITRSDGTTDTGFNTLTLASGLTGWTAGSWFTYSATALNSGAGQYSAGGIMTLRLTVSASGGNYVELGDITLPYLSKW